MTAEIPHQALYRRWRAQTFSEIVGQEAVVATLRNAVATGRVSHAILFTGPRGTGKTSLARILAKALNCTDLQPNSDPCDRCASCVAIREGRALDLVEIDAASNRGIEAVRELRERLAYTPTDLKRKVYILDEAHQITRDAWNALLKSLEEPPEFVTFMFASTHPQEFPPAILSRLQRFDVRRLTVPEISGKLERILAADGRRGRSRGRRARRAPRGRRDARRGVDPRPAARLDRWPRRGRGRPRAARPRRRRDRRQLRGRRSRRATPRPGIALLDELEDRGRDLRVFLDQVVDAIRERLLAGLTPRDRRRGRADRRRPPAGRHRPDARWVRAGLRLQLELALLDPTAGRPRPRPAARRRGAAIQRPRPAPWPTRPPRRRPRSAPSPTDGRRPPRRRRMRRSRRARARRRSPPPPGPPHADDGAGRRAAREPAAAPAAADAPTPRPAPADGPPSASQRAGRRPRALRRGWPEVVAAVSKSPPLKPLIEAVPADRRSRATS